MIRVAALLLILLAGCAPRGGRRSEPAPPNPPPDRSAVARAADSSMTDYREQAARAAESMAGRIGEFSDWNKFSDAWQQENKAARERAFEPFSAAVNESLFQRAADGSWKTDGPIDRAKVEAALREVAKGFRGK